MSNTPTDEECIADERRIERTIDPARRAAMHESVLMRLRLELCAAAQLFKGEQLEGLRDLLETVQQIMPPKETP